MSKGNRCYYDNEFCDYGEPMWQCQTCSDWFCQFHGHATSQGKNVECVACEGKRISRTIPERTVRTIAGTRRVPERAVAEWHTKECLEATEKCKALRVEYVSSWPYYCRKCKGEGGHWYNYDPSPTGVALSPGYMMDVDPCPLCCESLSVCPRCGEPLPEQFWEDDSPCPHCGWDWCRNPDDALPPLYECNCWSLETPDQMTER